MTTKVTIKWIREVDGKILKDSKQVAEYNRIYTELTKLMPAYEASHELSEEYGVQRLQINPQE